MNNIEQMFWNAYQKRMTENDEDYKLEPQVVIGLHKVDFACEAGFDMKFAVEIDGHDFHKTKEQREKDYKRERYLMRQGYIPIRFTGTEVFLEADKCVDELLEIIESFTLVAEILYEMR